MYIYIYVPTCFFCLFLPSILCFFAYMVSMRNFAIVFLPLAFGKPHVLFVLVDDLGWANVGFNRDPPIPKSVVTPNLDRLAGQGIRLKRHYVHKMCTPTRTSVQSGRLPVHVNTGLGDVCDDATGIPYNMTGLAGKMKSAGYKTHFAGKWDAGMATPRHTPHGRGYDTSLNYFSHKNDFYSQSNMQTCCEGDRSIIDFWRTNKGASDVNGSDYSEFLYQTELLNIIESHNPADPLFLFYAPHVAHCPLQVPKEYYDKFDFMTDDEGLCSIQTVQDEHPIDPNHLDLKYRCRRQHAAMIMIMDEVVGNLTNALQKKGMWNNTLMIFSSDNGGPVRLAENAANNWPLRGGKYSNFEGGVRVAAFVSGGFIPGKLRGSCNEGLLHIADWYATLCRLVGLDPRDLRAASAALPPIDSLDVWPMLTEGEKSPREVIPLGPDALIWGTWKLLTEAQRPSFWQGPSFPNRSSTASESTWAACAEGCLFELEQDPTEQRNLYRERPDIVSRMIKRLENERVHFFENNDSFSSSCPTSASQHCACWMAHHRYGGFLGPYALLDRPIASVVV